MNIPLISLLASLLSICPLAAPAAEMPRRGMFVSVLQDPQVLYSRQAIQDLVAYARQARVDTLFVQIYRSNMAWFPSRVGDTVPYETALRKVGADPFQILLSEAHRSGIEVHAWLNLLSLGDNKNARLLKKYGPEVLTRNRKPKKTLDDYKIDNQYFLEPGDPRVRAELLTLVEEILRSYPGLDGIQFDYIRYPDAHPAYGHTKMNLQRFRDSSGLKTFNEDNRLWQKWKRQQVTDLLQQLAQRARGIRPHIRVSATGCMPYARAVYEAFQDWPGWVDKGIVDFVTVMNYSTDAEEYARWLANAKTKTKNFYKVNIGLGAYKSSSSLRSFKQEYQICEQSGARGCVVFHYGSLLQTPALSHFFAGKKEPSQVVRK